MEHKTSPNVTIPYSNLYQNLNSKSRSLNLHREQRQQEETL